MKKNRLFVSIDQSMIWEAYSDQPITLIIRNNDKLWIRYLKVIVSSQRVDENEEILKALKDGKIEQTGLKEEQAKHSKTYKQKKV